MERFPPDAPLTDNPASDSAPIADTLSRAEVHQRVLELGSEIVLLLADNGQHLFLSPKAEALFGTTVVSLHNRTIWEVFALTSESRFARAFQRVVTERNSGGGPGVAEWNEWFAPVNAWQRIRLVARPEGVYSFFQEIATSTVGTAGEDALSVQEALEASEERFRLLAENARDLISLSDSVGRYVYVNPAFARTLLYAPAELLSRDAAEIIHPDDVLHLAEHFREGEHYQLRVRRRDGEYRWLEGQRYAITVQGQTQVVSIARDITARIKAEAVRDERLRQQERIAETLQRSLLVKLEPGELPGLSTACQYAAASDEAKVGGDFFDGFRIGEHKVALVVGDVSGKGLDSAARTAELKYALRVYLRESDDPGQALSRLNTYVRRGQVLGQYGAELLIALILVVVDTQTGTVVSATGGIDPPLLLRPDSGQTLAIEAGGLPVGAIADAEYPTARCFLEPGDVLFLFTDGLTETRRRRGESRAWEFLGYDGVAEAARKAARNEPDLDIVAETVLAHARGFAGGPLQDDVCLLLARYEPTA